MSEPCQAPGEYTNPNKVVANPKHSAKSQEHFSPKPIIDAARKVMGAIDLDPASCELANTMVGAERFFGKALDGLAQDWQGRVFCNPPGGRRGNKSLPVLFWEKLTTEWLEGRVEQAIFLAFSLEFLQTGQRSSVSPMSVPFCVPSKRLKFWVPNEDGTDLVEGKHPTHANAVVYLPPGGRRWRNDLSKTLDFEDSFEQFGTVVVP